jgi:hypothetical protein
MGGSSYDGDLKSFHQSVKLGKAKPRIDHRTLKMAKYLPAALPAPPVSVDWSGGVSSWGMMENNSLGDCTCAGRGHAVQVFTLAATGTMRTIPDSEIVAEYSRDCGYVAGDPSTDNGGVEIDVLNAWRQLGIGVGGVEKLTAYVAVSPDDQIHTKLAVQLFGGAYIGLALPINAQGQNEWDLIGDGQTGDSTPGSWGGHAVFVLAYNTKGPVVITWGQLVQMTWSFWAAYVDEAYALLSPDFINAKGTSASGFDVQTLLNDMRVVTA